MPFYLAKAVSSAHYTGGTKSIIILYEQIQIFAIEIMDYDDDRIKVGEN